jgi:hypothetical protein
MKRILGKFKEFNMDQQTKFDHIYSGDEIDDGDF